MLYIAVDVNWELSNRHFILNDGVKFKCLGVHDCTYKKFLSDTCSHTVIYLTEALGLKRVKVLVH